MTFDIEVEKLVVHDEWTWRASYVCTVCNRGDLDYFYDVAMPEWQVEMAIRMAAEDHHCMGFGGE